MAITIIAAGIFVGIAVVAAFMLLLAVTLMIKIAIIAIIAVCLLKAGRKLVALARTSNIKAMISSGVSLLVGIVSTAIFIGLSFLLISQSEIIEMQTEESKRLQIPIRASISGIPVEPIIHELNDKVQTRISTEIKKRINVQSQNPNKDNAEKKIYIINQDQPKTETQIVVSSNPCLSKEKAYSELNQKIIETLAPKFSKSGKVLAYTSADPIKSLKLKPDYIVQFKEVGGDKYPIYTASVKLDLESNLVQHLTIQENQRMARNRFETLLFGSTILVLGLGIWRKMI